ncbi:MAG: LysR family transcriptional regulator [Wenzhouxiangellaceae bacterium]
MDRITSLKILNQVVEAGSFVAAAERLKLSTAAVSRHVAALEKHLGSRLLHRTTRSLSLTEAGRLYLERVNPLVDEWNAAEQAVRDKTLSPSGRLRINAPVSFGMRHLGAALSAFRQQAPDLELDVDLSDRVSDLAEDGYDLALRIGRLPPSALVSRPLTPIRLLLCAAPEYLRQAPPLRQPGDLQHHRCLIYSYLSQRYEWQFEDRSGRRESVRVKGAVTANNGDLLNAMAIQGDGIVLQPSFIAHQAIVSGELRPLLNEWQAPPLHLYAVYLHRRHLSAKVRALIDFLATYWTQPPPWDQFPGAGPITE